MAYKKYAAAVLVACLASSAAFAAGREALPIASSPAVSTGLSGADLSTSPVSSPIKVDKYSLLKITINLTRDAADDVGFFCEESDDGTTNWAEITKVESNTVTLFNPARAVTASIVYSVRLDVTGFIFVRCTFSGTNATSSDLFTVTGRLIRGI